MTTDTTDTNTPVNARTQKSGAQPRKRRMAREREGSEQQTTHADSRDANDKPSARELRGPSKIAAVIALLEREQGATVAEMVNATGWLPHTTRAALTGLKKKGRAITRGKRGDVTCYHIQKAL